MTDLALFPQNARLAMSAVALIIGGLVPAAAQAQQGGNQCAIYGADFVAVQGTGSCVRIGGRVRLELNTRVIGHAYAPGGLDAAAAPAQGALPAPAEGVNRAHLRLENSAVRTHR